MKSCKLLWGHFIVFLCLVNPLYGQQAPWYNTEPTLNFDVHDPCIIKDATGRYTMLTTNNLLTLRQSTNLMSWTTPGRVFSSLPPWTVQQISGVENLWAPHLVFMGGRYYAYYSASSFGSNDSGIGVASSATLDPASSSYGWTDHGMVILSEGQNFNAIDPEVIQDHNGNWWMIFGSFWSTGIRMVQINPNTGKRTAENNTIHALADRNGGAIEGPSMIYNNGYYYLFVAYDACCQGVNSTYRTMVGRSASITGPYVDKQGNDMRNNAATEVLAGYDRYHGTGHGSVFKDNRRDYFVHHYYNGNRNGFPTPQIREIIWGEDGWPILSQPFLGRRQAYEAEHAKLVNAEITSATNASAGSYVGYINFADSRVNFHINALQAGEYTVHIRYAAGGGAASHFLSVNGLEQVVEYPATAAWGSFPQGQTVKVSANLKAGYNLLSFRPGNGFAELDRIDLFRNAGSVIEAGSLDDGVGADFVSSGNNASLSSGSWSKFEYVDFGNGGFNTLNIKAGGNCNGSLRFNIDGVNASTNATATVNLTAGQAFNLTLPESFTALTNTHDVYYTYTGSQACVLDEIQFSNATTPVVDCNGVSGGTAYLDDCDNCVGGNTGETACVTGNPIIRERFSADPAALVYQDTVFLYVGRDEAPPNATDFVLNRWDVYSSCDMVNWTHRGSPLSIDSFDWAWAAAFAGQCVERDGKFYWYVPMLGRNNMGAGPYFSIGVAVADSPTGPFADALGVPLISDAATADVWFDIDPSVFVDDDGQAYIYWGNVTQGDLPSISPMKMAKLNDDMTSIVPGSIQTVTLGNGNNFPLWVEAPYLHKKGSTYYLSYAGRYPEQIVYCTGPSPEGPWTYRGLLNDYVRSETNHQSIIEYKGRDYFIYHNYYPEIGGDNFRRSVAIEDLFYNADGTIQQIVQTTTGATGVECTPVISDCNGTVNGTATIDNCDRCVGGTTGKTACSGVDEAEVVACEYEGGAESVNAGFNGTGYINGINAAGASLTFRVSSATNGNAALSFRYASATNRPAEVLVNGTALPAVLGFASTGNWTTWGITEVMVPLVQGDNVITLSATSADGLANIDQIGYVDNTVSTASCIVTGLGNGGLDNMESVYPNPSSGGFHIRKNGDFNYQVLSMDGKQIEAGSGSNAVKVGDGLPSGFYFLKIYSQTGSSVTKIYKIK